MQLFPENAQNVMILSNPKTLKGNFLQYKKYRVISIQSNLDLIQINLNFGLFLR